MTQARVPHLEVRVEHLVGKPTKTDPDSLKHSIARELVHDQTGFHLSGFLVGVWHQATDKVGLTVVKGDHELGEGDQVDGGDRLATPLLLLLALLLRWVFWLPGVVSPKMN